MSKPEIKMWCYEKAERILAMYAVLTKYQNDLSTLEGLTKTHIQIAKQIEKYINE